MQTPPIIFAFIDSQNLNLAIKDCGWELDFKRFRIHLKDRYGVEKAFLFLGYISGNQGLYEHLKKAGYHLIFKPTLDSGHGIIKGNCDAELVLHTMIQYPNFDQAIIVSGDGDFYCLIEYLIEQKKIFKVGVPNMKKYSSLLRKFRQFFFYVTDLRHKLEYQKR
jgi:uncharacterized LabA/DUF88 family protein